MSKENHEVEVDLSDDADDATLDEIEQETEQGPPDPRTAPESDDEGDGSEAPSLTEQAQQEAARQYKAAEGPDREARLEGAINQTHEAIQTHAKQLQQFKKEHADTEDRIERLQMTKERVLDQPEDVPVLQTLAGGISLQVPANANGYDRDDLVDEIDETVEAAESYVESLGERLETMEVEIKKAQQAGELLTESLEKERRKSNSTEELREEIEQIDRGR